MSGVPKSGKNKGKTNRKKNNTIKRRRINTPYMSPIVSNTNIPKALAFIDYLKTLPTYIIHAHSIPRSPKHLDKVGIQHEFIIPDDTFLLSLTQAGEFMCSSRYTAWRVNYLKDEYRKYLHVHSPDDIISIREKYMHSTAFGGIRRAGASSTYPNIAYGFKEKDRDLGGFFPADTNINGVYDITKLPPDSEPNLFTNAHSIIRQEETKDDPDYMLKDIIQTVYARTGIDRGIFIIMGCLVTTNINTMDKIGRQMDVANAEYTDKFETFTKEELLKHSPSEIPYELGMYGKYVHPLSEEMALNMVKKGLLTKGNRAWIENILPTNRAPLREKLKNVVLEPFKG